MTLRPMTPEVAEQNRELLAKRRGWPDGALEACRELEQRYPGWHIWFDVGGVPASPDPVYRAYQDPSLRPRREEQAAATPDELSELIRQSDQDWEASRRRGPGALW